MLYSYSRLKTFDCPRRFYNIYLLGRKEPSGEPAFLGKVVHASIERLISGKDTDEIEAVKNSLKLIEKEERNNGFCPPSIHIEEAITLTRNAKAEKGIGKVEEHFQLLLDPDNPDIFTPSLQGYIDLYSRVDSTVILTDWKTSRIPYHPLQNHQLGLYAWALSQITGAKEVLGVLRFLRYEDAKETHLYTREDMEKSREWALSRARTIEKRLIALDGGEDFQKLFPENPESGLCKYCTFTAGCGSEIPEKINTHKDAVAIAAKVLLLKAETDRLQNMVKNYCKATDNSIIVGEEEYSKSFSTRWTFNEKAKEELYDILITQDIDPLSIFTLGSKEVKLLQKLGFDKTKLEEIGAKMKTIETYRWSKTQTGVSKNEQVS